MSRKKVFIIFGIIILIVVALIFLSIHLQKKEYNEKENQQSSSLMPIPQNITEPQDSPQEPREDTDVIQTHPIRCNASLGFDDYRTEQAFAVNPKNNKEMYINIEYRG